MSKSSSFVLVFVVVLFTVANTIPFDIRSNNDETIVDKPGTWEHRFQSLTSEQLAELDEFLSRKLDDESLRISSSEVLYRHTRRPYQRSLVKRHVLSTNTELLDCIRRLKQSTNNNTKVELATEMLNCQRRVQHHNWIRISIDQTNKNRTQYYLTSPSSIIVVVLNGQSRRSPAVTSIEPVPSADI
jgi:hypothetical protein